MSRPDLQIHITHTGYHSIVFEIYKFTSWVRETLTKTKHIVAIIKATLVDRLIA